MARNEQPQHISSGDLFTVADTLQHFAERYRRLGEMLKMRVGPDDLTVRNWRSMQNALDVITKAVNRAYEAYDEDLIRQIPSIHEGGALAGEAIVRDHRAKKKSASKTKSNDAS